MNVHVLLVCICLDVFVLINDCKCSPKGGDGDRGRG